MAAIAVAAFPIGVTLTDSDDTPCRNSRYVSIICEEEPAVVTPAVRPFNCSMPVTVAALCGEVTSTSPGKRIMVTNAVNGRPSAAIWIVWS